MPPAFEDVIRLFTALPGVNLGTSYETPALRDLLNQCWRRLATQAQPKAAAVSGPS